MMDSKLAIGFLETTGFTPAMVALDAMEKAARIEVIQAEINDFLGICMKIQGQVAAVKAALEIGAQIARQMGGKPVVHSIERVEPVALTAVLSLPEYNPLIQQDVVTIPSDTNIENENETMSKAKSSFALGFIETQGFTAAFDAIDTACKAANVEVIGKEKLGGGFVTVVVKGDVAAVNAAIEAGRPKVEALGTLIAAHVIARPSPSVLNLLPSN